jgi:hypothetical protein
LATLSNFLIDHKDVEFRVQVGICIFVVVAIGVLKAAAQLIIYSENGFSVRGDVEHNWSKSQCFQVQPVTCCDL